MTAKATEFHNSYLAELSQLKRYPAPQIMYSFQDDLFSVPTSVTAISVSHYVHHGYARALADLSNNHEITIAVVAEDDDKALVKHLLDQHVAVSGRHGNVTTVDRTVELINKIMDLCESPGIILYNVGNKLTEMYGEKHPLGLLNAILSRTDVAK